MALRNASGMLSCRTAARLLLVMAVLLESMESSKGEAPADPKNELRTMVVRVVDDNGKPLEKSRVHVSVWPMKDYAGPKISNKDYLTDAKGNAEITIPRRLWILRLWASKAGHVPRFVNFWNDGPDKQKDIGPNIPETFPFQLEKGSEIGGKIVDEAGRPIPGVKVEVSVSVEEPKEWGSDPKPIVSTWLTDEDTQAGPVVTDKNGHWRIDNAPAPKQPDDYRFRLLFTHKDYASDLNWGGLQAAQRLTTPELRERAATLILSRGVAVKGQVLHNGGLPVEKGLVIWDKDPYGKKTIVEAAIDKSGHFETLRLLPGKYPFTIVAPGSSPHREMVTVEKSMKDLSITLGPGKRLAIQFVDQAGKPIPKVSVGIANWRGEQALYNHNHPYYVPDSGIPRQADENGLYEWDWAPDDEVGFYFHAEGYKTRSQTLAADEDEHVITLESK